VTGAHEAGQGAGHAADAAARLRWIVELAPRVADLPGPIQKYDDPFLPYSRAIIEATAESVAGYWFDLAAYLALGAAGAIALERAVALVRAGGAHLTVLHGPFARGDYAALAGRDALHVDAATITERRVAAQFEATGVRPLPPFEQATSHHDGFDDGYVSIAGQRYSLLRQSFLSQFVREDFVEQLRAAAARLAT
jgi:hypothetical protein